MTEYGKRVVALSGGIGGAKLALGLSRIVPGENLVIVANTGDDFEHLGLRISPDLDTLMYTLAGLANLDAGWGRAGETWTFMAALERLGGRSVVPSGRRGPRHPRRAHPPSRGGRELECDHRRIPPTPRRRPAGVTDVRSTSQNHSADP